MAFTNLYTKSTANPKDIDFVKVGTTVKNKIPEAAVKAFRAKVPGVQAKAFEFKFDKDYDTGKMQIAVKQVGFVHGWVDETFVANKAKMKAVETELDGWKGRMASSLQSLGVHKGELVALAKRVEAMEAGAKGDTVDEAMLKEHGAVEQGLQKWGTDVNGVRSTTMTFWGGEPQGGVAGLMKKHGIAAEQMSGERKDADASYAVLQQEAKNFSEQLAALVKGYEGVKKRADTVGVDLSLLMNGRRDKKTELEEMEVAIQKDIGDFQGRKNSDFEGAVAKAVMQDAKEFMAKAGGAWVRLSGNPGEIDKAATHVEGFFQSLRVRGGAVLTQYQAWQKPTVPRGGNMPKYQGMLKMVYEEYMGALNGFQDTLKLYKAALLKQRPKAVELEKKTVKATVKAEAKVAKAEAKAVKKGR